MAVSAQGTQRTIGGEWPGSSDALRTRDGSGNSRAHTAFVTNSTASPLKICPGSGCKECGVASPRTLRGPRFLSTLGYVCSKRGVRLKRVDAAYTSKTCSVCGIVVDLKLTDRDWKCQCGAYHDRDVNAAINILGRAFPNQRGDVKRLGGNSFKRSGRCLI